MNFGIGRAKAVFLILVFASIAFVLFISGERDAASRPVFIFAYGSNLEKATFSSRAGGFENAAPAKLPGYALAFQANRNSEFGVANIVYDAGGEVPGAIYTISREQEHALDASMGAPDFYRRITARAVAADGRWMDVETYILAGNAHAAHPSRPSVEAAAKGLEQFGYGDAELGALTDAAGKAGDASG